MRYSKLKNDLEMMKLQHKHEVALLQMEHEQAEKELLSKCTHTYEDGTSAKTTQGVQLDFWYECDICGQKM